MDKHRRPASFLQRWTRPRPSPRAEDPADYGTAFGLDLSFGPVSEEAPAVAPPVPAAPGWWARWRQRAA